MNRRFSIILLSILSLALMSSCRTTVRDASGIQIVEEQSYYCDYSVSGEEVIIKCVLYIKNTNDYFVEFGINGNFPNDKGVLLMASHLNGIDSSTGNSHFVLSPYEEKSFEVQFIGAFAGTNQKNDRLLPELEIRTVDQ